PRRRSRADWRAGPSWMAGSLVNGPPTGIRDARQRGGERLPSRAPRRSSPMADPTPDPERFRAELVAWLEQHAPPSLRGAVGNELEGIWGGRKAKWPNPDAKRWLDACAERGFTAPEWPRAYGGGGLSREEARVLRQELARLRMPPPLIGFGLTMIGPVLLQFGTEEQKREHLPRICRGEIRWCQGYSEP